MPKDMFYKIKNEKQQKIIDAAMFELTTKSFTEVSILSISKRAEISRGSFYNYFDTVGEILEYLIDLLKKERQVYAPKLFKKSNNDLFDFVINLIKFDYDSFISKSRYSLLKNFLQYLSLSNKSFKDFFLLNVLDPILSSSDVELYDTTKYNVTEEEFYQAIELLGHTITSILISGEKNSLSKNEIFIKLDFTVNLVKSGLQNYQK